MGESRKFEGPVLNKEKEEKKSEPEMNEAHPGDYSILM